MIKLNIQNAICHFKIKIIYIGGWPFCFKGRGIPFGDRNIKAIHRINFIYAGNSEFFFQWWEIMMLVLIAGQQ